MNKEYPHLPFDVMSWAVNLNIEIRKSAAMPAKMAGFMKKTENGYTILVNSRDSLHQQKFTTAYLMACHFTRINEEIIKLNKAGTDYNDTTAMSLAARLLMPEDIFKKYWEEEDCSVSRMSDIFGVSESVIIARAVSLKLAREDARYFV